MTPPPDHIKRQARAAKADVEDALDRIGWRWIPGISNWLEALVTIAEGPEP